MSDLQILHTWTFGGEDYQLCQERGVAFVRSRDIDPSEWNSDWYNRTEEPEIMIALVELATFKRHTSLNALQSAPVEEKTS